MSFNESREIESENAFQVGNALLQGWRGGRRGVPWSGLCRAAQQRSEQRRNGSEGASRAHEEASPLAVSRPQPLNEDPSDCAEACPSAKQAVFAVAIGCQ